MARRHDTFAEFFYDVCGCWFTALPQKETETKKSPREKDPKVTPRQQAISRLNEAAVLHTSTPVDVDEVDVNQSESDLLLGEKLDDLVRSTKSLIQHNKTVIDRCELYRKGPVTQFSFHRLDLKDVVVTSSKSDEDGGTVQFYTTPERPVLDMRNPDPIPQEIADIIVQTDGVAGLPDYETFWERAVLLHNGVLKPFLKTFRAHLESIQAYYQHVDAWVKEPDADREYLERTFDIRFDLAAVKKPVSVKKKPVREEQHPDAEEKRPEGEDRPNPFSESEGESEKLATGSYDEILFEDRTEDGEEHEPLKLIDNRAKLAVPGEALLIKEVHSDGEFSLYFDIEQDGQKRKLSKFVDFLSG